MKRLLVYYGIALLSLQFVVSGCAAKLGRMNDAQKAERLALERGRLSSLTDPVTKTRSYITISTILLDFAAAAGHDGQMETMTSLLDQYTDAIRSALNTMVKSNRDADRQPAGYKDLDLALRQQVRILTDLNKVLSFDQRPLVEEALRTATLTREQVLRLLFPKGASH